MNIFVIISIAVGLAMDAFAVSVGNGLAVQKVRIRYALRVGLFFGLFQAVMPIIGWSAGGMLRGYIEGFDHWAAFILLSIIGGRMIYESFMRRKETPDKGHLTCAVLFMLSVATSIDAFAVGVSFAILDISLFTPVIIIGTVTFILSFAGVYIGSRIGHFFENRVEAAGGIVLIGIGIYILVTG